MNEATVTWVTRTHWTDWGKCLNASGDIKLCGGGTQTRKRVTDGEIKGPNDMTQNEIQSSRLGWKLVRSTGKLIF